MHAEKKMSIKSMQMLIIDAPNDEYINKAKERRKRLGGLSFHNNSLEYGLNKEFRNWKQLIDDQVHNTSFKFESIKFKNFQ